MNGRKDQMQQFRPVIEGLLEVLQDCERCKDRMLGGV